MNAASYVAADVASRLEVRAELAVSRPRQSGSQQAYIESFEGDGGVSVLEASDGLDVTAFMQVAGQVIYSKILDAYTQEAFVASRLVQTVPTRLDGERIPGMKRVADDVDVVAPAKAVPLKNHW